MFKLEVHICDQRRSYDAEFATEAQAVDFITRHTDMNHAFYEIDDYPVPEGWDELAELLNPTCQHGLSLALCAGPGHYPQD